MKTLWFISSALAVSVAATLNVFAGTFTTDFSSDPGGTAIGNAQIEGGVLKLTDLQDLIDGTATLPLNGSYILPAIDSGPRVAAFTATFTARIGGGTEQAAQGFSFVLADDLPTDGTTTFREGGGTSKGLVVSFDTVDNLAGFNAEGNDPGDAPGIIVKMGGVKVGAHKFSGLRTGANFVPVQVKLDPDGTLDVTYNGVKVYDNYAVGYTPIAGNFGFGAGTAELTAAIRDNHWIDDLSITTTTVSGSFVLAAEPLGVNVRPDAIVRLQIQDLGTDSATLNFDGQPVTPAIQTAGNVTTLTFDPPGLLVSASSHSVTLSYGSKTFSYGFTVATLPTIPASSAAESGTVDLSKGGFKIRVYQTDQAAAGGNTYERAIGELAGLYGANVADLSQANPDGTFDRDLINFDQDGGEAGVFNTTEGHPDAVIPGIPGTTASTDNIAMEVLAFVDLQPGVYKFGIVSDDNARLSVGADPRDATALRLIDIPIGTGTASFIVDQAGIYPFRLIWAEGTGAANVEWWAEDAAGQRTLINDRAAAGHLKSYNARTTDFKAPPYVSSAKPAPGDANVSIRPRIELQITEETTTMVETSIQLSLNGAQLTLPAGAVTKSGKVTTITYQVNSTLAPLTAQSVRLAYTDSAGKAATRDYSFTTGKSVASPANSVKGQWDFDKGSLRATIGRDLRFIDDTLANRYQFGTTTSFGIPAIGGKEAKVLHVPFTDRATEGDIFRKIGLRMAHNIAPNGGGRKVNQWTLIMDLYWGDEGPSGFGSVLQTHDLDNPTDGDMFWRASDGSYGKGCCSLYDNIDPNHNHARGQWRRVVFGVDLAANPPVFAKYIDGFKHRQDVTGDGAAVDSRFGLPPEVFLFGDGDDDERTDCYVNSIQIREGRLTDEDVLALGGPSADGIPLFYAQWDFDDGNLAATVGHDLGYIDDTLASRYQFGTTTSFGIPAISGRDARVIHVPFTDRATDGDIFRKIGLRMPHGLGANGGGQKLNQYTLIMDVLWGDQGPSGFGSILQTHDLDNPTDGDMFWRASDGSYGKGCCSLYDNIDPAHNHPRGEWRRVVFGVDLAANPPVFAKYLDGFKHRQDVTGDGAAVDSRFGLPPEVFLFGDGDDDERTDCYVNAIQIRAGRMTDEEVASLGAASADGIPNPNPVKGEWNFDDGTLAAFVGQDLHFIDDALASRYQFGTTTQFAIPGVESKEVKVLHVPFTDRAAEGDIFRKIGLRMRHGIAPNGGGTKVNQWTLIMDLLWGADGPSGFGSVLQTHDLDNPTDGDMFWRASDGSYGKGCCSLYDAIDPTHNHPRGEWRRVVFAVDLAANPPVFAKYLDGFKHRQDVTGDGAAVDSRFGLPPEVFLFGDGDDDERTDCYVNAIQIREGRMTDEEVLALGAASALGIPSAPGGGVATATLPAAPKLQVGLTGSDLRISLVGGVGTLTLQRRADLNPGSSWQDVGPVSGSSVTITNALIGTQGYYRIRAQ